MKTDNPRVQQLLQVENLVDFIVDHCCGECKKRSAWFMSQLNWHGLWCWGRHLGLPFSVNPPAVFGCTGILCDRPVSWQVQQFSASSGGALCSSKVRHLEIVATLRSHRHPPIVWGRSIFLPTITNSGFGQKWFVAGTHSQARMFVENAPFVKCCQRNGS